MCNEVNTILTTFASHRVIRQMVAHISNLFHHLVEVTAEWMIGLTDGLRVKGMD